MPHVIHLHTSLARRSLVADATTSSLSQHAAQLCLIGFMGHAVSRMLLWY